MNNAILLISCPDRKGITARVSNFIYEHGGNIEHADQHIDPQSKTFFMRIEWALEDFNLKENEIGNHFQKIARKFKMQWSLYFTKDTPKIAIFTSQYLHCLYDIIFKCQEKKLPAQIGFIVSNHRAAEKLAEKFNLKFFYFPVSKTNIRKVEKKQIELIKKEGIELIVLARYLRILSPHFVRSFPLKIINIHHSFLPAFVGKNPYGQAYKRGVKIIGATSHYVVEELDRGPIIEQDTVRITHRDSLEDIHLKGEDLERCVLSRALNWHLKRKILVYNNKTVILD